MTVAGLALVAGFFAYRWTTNLERIARRRVAALQPGMTRAEVNAVIPQLDGGFAPNGQDKTAEETFVESYTVGSGMVKYRFENPPAFPGATIDGRNVGIVNRQFIQFDEAPGVVYRVRGPFPLAAPTPLNQTAAANQAASEATFNDRSMYLLLAFDGKTQTLHSVIVAIASVREL